MPLQFRGTAELHRSVLDGIPHLPEDIDLIVGVPRSGLLPASIIATALDLPLTDVDGLREGRLIRAASRSQRATLDAPPDHARLADHAQPIDEAQALDASPAIDEAQVVRDAAHVLVIDDSIGHGSQLRKTREQLADLQTSRTISFGAVYATPSGAELADVVFERVPWGRAFGWNLMHHDLLDACCLDADGVLWPGDAAPRSDHDPSPIWQPTTSVGWIVTGHGAEHAPAVRAWLAARSITYRGLIMPRRTLGRRAQARFKARVHARTAATLFITDEPQLARTVRRRSGRTTLSLRAQQLEVPSLPRRALRRVTSELRAQAPSELRAQAPSESRAQARRTRR